MLINAMRSRQERLHYLAALAAESAVRTGSTSAFYLQQRINANQPQLDPYLAVLHANAGRKVSLNTGAFQQSSLQRFTQAFGLNQSSTGLADKIAADDTMTDLAIRAIELAYEDTLSTHMHTVAYAKTLGRILVQLRQFAAQHGY